MSIHLEIEAHLSCSNDLSSRPNIIESMRSSFHLRLSTIRGGGNVWTFQKPHKRKHDLIPASNRVLDSSLKSFSHIKILLRGSPYDDLESLYFPIRSYCNRILYKAQHENLRRGPTSKEAYYEDSLN